MPAPNRGEVWIVDLGMAGKVRPSVVLSVPAGPQDRALVTLVAHTTSARGSNFEVDVRSRFLATVISAGTRSPAARREARVRLSP
ncbi:MAG: type II toxin-antitoxin system PemK/MazF family toxin [Isosphaerales bacterium]